VRVSSTEVQNAFGKYLALTEQEDILITKNQACIARLTQYHEEAESLPGGQQPGSQSPFPAAGHVRPGAGPWRPDSLQVTYEQYQALAASGGQRSELINGVLYTQAAPALAHQVILQRLLRQLLDFFADGSCLALPAPLDVQLHDQARTFAQDPNVVQPDILVIDDPDQVGPEGQYLGKPILLIEILAPATRSRDLVAKLNLFQRSGIAEYWVADPGQGCLYRYTFSNCQVDDLQVYRQTETVEARAFPGLAIPLAGIFIH
jgi:Uma2 family endonuclease